MTRPPCNHTKQKVKQLILLVILYEGESVNRSQMDIKRKTWYSNVERFISRHIIHQHRYTCPIALPVRQNPQSFDCWFSHFHTSDLTSLSSVKCLLFLADQRDKVTRGKVQAVGQMFKNVPLYSILSWVARAVWGLALSWWTSTPLASWPGSFLRIASRSSNRPSQYDAEFTFSPVLLRMG
jgi:hypothetical protein